MKKIVRFVFLSSLLFTIAGFSWADEKKIALVIGNAAYEGRNALVNPVRDADSVTSVLEILGFSVKKITNVSKKDMLSGIAEFSDNASKADIALFFYAGHGIGYNNDNFLIPLDASFASSDTIPQDCVSIMTIMNQVERAQAGAALLFIDACRDVLFRGGGRGPNRGFYTVQHNPPRTFCLFSTQFESSAEDGNGTNSPFTTHLIKNIVTPGQNISDLAGQIYNGVMEDTKNTQAPTFMGRLDPRTIVLVPGNEIVPPQPEPSPQPKEIIPPAGYSYVQGGVFSMGNSADGAGNRISQSPRRDVIIKNFFIAQKEVTQAEWQKVMGTTIRNQLGKNEPEIFLRGEGSDLPMYYVNWYEALSYCNKLSQLEGKKPAYRTEGNVIYRIADADGYRLPTEAEWEFAARGGRSSKGYSCAGSNDPGAAAWYDKNSSNMVHPVGTKTPNELGIFDMSGNVAEWCWDWSGSYGYAGQIEPAGPAYGDEKIVRGGSFRQINGSGDVTTFNRESCRPLDRQQMVGIRLVLPVQEQE